MFIAQPWCTTVHCAAGIVHCIQQLFAEHCILLCILVHCTLSVHLLTLYTLLQCTGVYSLLYIFFNIVSDGTVYNSALHTADMVHCVIQCTMYNCTLRSWYRTLYTTVILYSEQLFTVYCSV